MTKRSSDHHRAPHCTIDELLAIRDGEGSDGSRCHLGDCQECREALDRLHQTRARLRALPSLAPPRDRWPQVRELWLREQSRRRMGRVSMLLAALAATVLFAVVSGAWTERRERARQLAAERAELETDLATLREHSQLLEAELRAVASPTVWSGWRVEAIVGVEDRIAELDRELRLRVGDSSGDDSNRSSPSLRSPDSGDLGLALWRERVELQGALFQLHVAPVSHRGL